MTVDILAVSPIRFHTKHDQQLLEIRMHSIIDKEIKVIDIPSIFRYKSLLCAVPIYCIKDYETKFIANTGSFTST